MPIQKPNKQGFKIKLSEEILEKYYHFTDFKFTGENPYMIYREIYDEIFSFIQNGSLEFHIVDIVTFFAIAKENYLTETYSILTTQNVNLSELQNLKKFLFDLKQGKTTIKEIIIHSKSNKEKITHNRIGIKDKQLLELLLSLINKEIDNEFPMYPVKREFENNKIAYQSTFFFFNYLREISSSEVKDSQIKLIIGYLFSLVGYLENESNYLKIKPSNEYKNYNDFLTRRVATLIQNYKKMDK